MPTIIDELQILSEPEPKAGAKDPARPTDDESKERPPRVRDLIDAERWARRRELRVRAH